MKTNNQKKISLYQKLIGRLVREEDGFAMEYTVIVLLVAAVVVGLVLAFSGGLTNMWDAIIKFMNMKTAGEAPAIVEGVNTGRDNVKEDGKTAAGAASDVNGFGGK